MMITHKSLEKYIYNIFLRSGCNHKESTFIAYHLVLANLVGHDSHGVIRVPRYIQHLKDRKVVPNVTPKIEKDNNTMLTIDGLGGFGQTVGNFVTGIGIERALNNGLCVIALKNSGHLGRIGDWAEIAAENKIISLHFVNTTGLGLLVAPYGSSDRRFSTNPFAAGIPIPNKPPFILDFATSTVAEGKMLVALQGGKTLPENSLIDNNGILGNNPKIVYGEVGKSPNDIRKGKGSIRAMGEHKGSGLAFLCELLAGALTGGGTARENEKKLRNGMLSIFIEPNYLIDKSSIEKELMRYFKYFKSASPIDNKKEVLFPGEVEFNNKKERIKNGIPITENTWKSITEVGDELGVKVN